MTLDSGLRLTGWWALAGSEAKEDQVWEEEMQFGYAQSEQLVGHLSVEGTRVMSSQWLEAILLGFKW